MRLSQEQLTSVKKAFCKVFEKGDVILFGSRVDDDKKGGDIDLYIKPFEVTNDLFEKRIAFLVELKKEIGVQKVDVVLESFAPEALKQEIEKTGVLICHQ